MSLKLGKTCRLVFALLALTLLVGASALAQTPTEADRARRAALRMANGREIPEATLPCTPEEAKWWQDLRKAAKAVQESRGGKREKQKYLALFQLGVEQSYQPPIPDQGALVLSRTQPSYSEAARQKMAKGTIALVVELRPDGFVGEVEVVQGLGSGLDQNAIDAAHETVFLPKIKNRKFERFLLPVTMSFSVY
jgi:TonB family protein